jgi:hypothetical protein
MNARHVGAGQPEVRLASPANRKHWFIDRDNTAAEGISHDETGIHP